ncbi:MAG: GHKL domain-containing protein [Verrucomicrobia bacterium]|nr:GHKL domain-containing protein [Verrucomicrobiota bacterium]
MSGFRRELLRDWLHLLSTSAPDQERVRSRIYYLERNIGLVVKAAVIIFLFYYLIFSTWSDAGAARGVRLDLVTRRFAFDVLQLVFLSYVAINLAVSALLYGMEQVPFVVVQWAVFTDALIDGLFLAGMTTMLDGYDSPLYWLFLGLIARNSISVPAAVPQIILNLSMVWCYVLAGGLDTAIARMDDEILRTPSESVLLRVMILLLMTVCCYGVQVLFDKQRRVEDEAREYVIRQDQLRATGRLAAEIAHQLKNPLGIINNAAFTLQRTVKEGKSTITQQIQIIREEVERSDRIITDLMGYARLTEGKVERIEINEELDRALDMVFPAAVKYQVQIHRDYAPALPTLMMQRGHLSEVLVNLLQNAREAMNGCGNVYVSSQRGEDYSAIISIADDGPGIPPELQEKIFESYFTTKEKGTGLGLAIVKHNVEIYGGNVQVESELGKGTRFSIQLPGRSLMKLRK